MEGDNSLISLKETVIVVDIRYWEILKKQRQNCNIDKWQDRPLWIKRIELEYELIFALNL